MSTLYAHASQTRLSGRGYVGQPARSMTMIQLSVNKVIPHDP